MLSKFASTYLPPRENKEDVRGLNGEKLDPMTNEYFDRVAISKQYPRRLGVYSWDDAYQLGLVSRNQAPYEIHSSGKLFLDQKQKLAAHLCLRCEKKHDGEDGVCAACRLELLPKHI